MFGYVTVNQEELKLKEYRRYRSFYCGLCHTLKSQYGHVGQMTLSYDMTFLVLLLTALYEAEGTEERHRCLAHPTEKHLMFENDCTRYAADMNILLSYHNCMDDWFDDKSLVKLSAAKLLERKYKELESRYPRQTKAMISYIEKLHASEKQNSADLDETAGYTGELLGQLFVWKQDEWAEILYKMGFYLGKFIYLMDAYDDLAKDEKKNNYNPWNHLKNSPDFEDTCYQILTMMMGDCAREFEKLPILQDAEILRNILYSGIWTKYDILQKEKGNSSA